MCWCLSSTAGLLLWMIYQFHFCSYTAAHLWNQIVHNHKPKAYKDTKSQTRKQWVVLGNGHLPDVRFDFPPCKKQRLKTLYWLYTLGQVYSSRRKHRITLWCYKIRFKQLNQKERKEARQIQFMFASAKSLKWDSKNQIIHYHPKTSRSRGIIHLFSRTFSRILF